MSKHRRNLYCHQLSVNTESSSARYQCAEVREEHLTSFVAPYEQNTFFLKYQPIKETEEEVLFSRLYQLDMGRGAATNYFYRDGRQQLGVASHALKSFIDYKSIFEPKNKDLLGEIFILDSQGKPMGFKLVKGLASVLMSAWLYGEDDLHRRNFGIYKDESGGWSWGRIDFGRSLPDITNHSRPLRASSTKDSEISFKRLHSFPLLAPEAPFYWPTSITSDNYHLNVRGQAKGNAYSYGDRQLFSMLSPDIDLNHTEINQARERFQQEKYEFLLRLWLRPLQEKQALILSMLTNRAYADRLAFNVESRVIQMRWAALCDKGFRVYLAKLFREGFDNEHIKAHSQLANVLDAIQSNTEVVASQSRGVLEKRAMALFKQTEKLLREPLEFDDAALQHVDELFSDIFREKHWLGDASRRANLKKALDKRLTQTLLSLLQQGLFDKARQQLQRYLSFRQAISPIVNLLTKTSDVCLKKKFKLLAENFVLPSFNHLVKRYSNDALFQHQISTRMRNIETIVFKLTKHGLSDVAINELVGTIPASREFDLSRVDSELKQIEKRLLISKYQQTFSLFNSGLFEADAQWSELANIQKFCLQVTKCCLPDFLEEQTSRAKHLQRINAAQLIRSLQLSKRLLIQLNESLISLNGDKQLEKQYVKFAKRIRHILCQHTIAPSFIRGSVASAEKALLEMNVLLSRFCLDVVCVQKKKEWQTMGGALMDEQKQRLIVGATQLSKALAKPAYHDTLSQHDVALAGMFGTRLLLKPSIGNAQQALRFSHYLSKSHQVRAKTWVALSLALIGVLALCLGISLLCPPLALVAIPTALSTSLVTAGSVAAGGCGAFAAYRFFRDKDKVQRKLEGVGEKALPISMITSKDKSPNILFLK